MGGKKKYTLVIKEGEKTVCRFPLHGGRIYQVGRDKKVADIVLEHARISRRHCSIRYDEEKECLWVKDFSSNGCALSDGSDMFQNIFVKVGMQEEILFTNTEYRISIQKNRSFLKRLYKKMREEGEKNDD